MALSWFDRKPQDSGEWAGFLEKGVRFEGKLEVPGTFRLDAAIKGTLISAGTLILGEHSSMEGHNRRECRHDRRSLRGDHQCQRESRDPNGRDCSSRDPHSLPEHRGRSRIRWPLPHAGGTAGQDRHTEDDYDSYPLSDSASIVAARFLSISAESSSSRPDDFFFQWSRATAL